MELGTPELERIKRKVSYEIMRERWTREGVVWDVEIGAEPHRDERTGEQR